MHTVDEIIKLMRDPRPRDLTVITKAFNFAKKVHNGQTRYSGEPYFNHVFETAKILAELGLGRRTICAGLLHDTIEDAHVDPETIESEFGKEILFLVEGVTKLGTIRYKGEDRHVESMRKFFVAMSKDLRVLIIKLADRLHNMRTLQFVPDDKRQRIAMETMEIYVPLAYRLGIRKIKREMEDLAFKFIHPEEYKFIMRMLKDKKVYDEKGLLKFNKSLLKAMAKADITDINSDYRLKSYYSVYRKLKHKRNDFEKIYDIYALRINVPTVSDCYKVLGVIHSTWRPLPGRIKDYIAFPKPNGYQSLHTTIFTGEGNIIEIQIRTHQMHENAEYGFASHLAYKDRVKLTDAYVSWFKQFFPKTREGSTSTSPKYSRVPQWIKDLVDVQSYVSIPTEFMSNLKTDFFEHRMFIFDKLGEVIDLPIESTPIDFAYALDKETGNHLFGAKVNGKLVPIETELKNGDIVQILTKSTSKPSSKWLGVAKTTLAKHEIRLSLNLADNQKIIE